MFQDGITLAVFEISMSNHAVRFNFFFSDAVCNTGEAGKYVVL